MNKIRKTMFHSIIFKHLLLMNYTVTLSSIIIITRQSFIQSSNAIAFIFFSSHAELLSSIPIHSLRSQNITSVNSGASNGEIIKATTLPEGMEVTMTNDNWGKVGDKDPVIGNGFIETTTGGTIVIVPDRTEDTPKTEPEKNPTTGANDMVAAAAALMAVSALGMAVLSRKK